MKIKKICVAVGAALMMLAPSCSIYADIHLMSPLALEQEAIEITEIPLEPFNSIRYYSSENVQIAYSYTSDVSPGTVRYISQLRRSKYFLPAYWGQWDGSTSIKCANGSWYGGPGQECFTSCISMALSYIGVNKTPEDILDFGGGITIVNSAWGGATYLNSSFSEAYDRYANGEGSYSPPIIHLDNYSSGGHYVLVIGKSSDNVYQVLDPARDIVWDLTFDGNTVTYTVENGSSRRDTVSSAHQYYMKSSQLVKPFMAFIDEPIASTLYENDITVKGWALYGNGISKVCGILNGNVFEIPLVTRLDVAAKYPGYPTGNEGFFGTIPVEYLKNGENELELIAYSHLKEFNLGTVKFSFNNPNVPEIKNVEVLSDFDGYTITCEVSDDYGIDRVMFPTWTASDGQDDLISDWNTSELTKGEIVDGQVSFRVNRSDHNNESGTYITHIYAYDIHGNHTIYPLTQFYDDVAPAVSDHMGVSEDNKYTISCTITDSSQIESVSYEFYKYSDGVYEICSEGSMDKITEDDDKYEVSLEIEKELSSCYYRTIIYVYDIYGNYTKDSLVVRINQDEEVTPDGKIPTEGSCGDNLTYSISEDYILTISGEGDMSDWPDELLRPWHGVKDHIKGIVIDEGVSSIGANAFKDFINLTGISFSATVSRIGEAAFNGAFSMEEMVLPKTINVVEANVFVNCPLLKNVTVLGKTTEILGEAFPENIKLTGYGDTPLEVYAKENAYEFRSLSGELNNDGLVNAADALLILKHAASLEKITDEISIDAADMNADIIIDAADALKVLKIAAKID